MASDSEIHEGYGPETQVWNHLHSGLDLARMEFDHLDPEVRASVQRFGKLIVQARTSLALEKDHASFVEVYDWLWDDPWYRHAAEIEMGYEGVARASMALDRLLELKPVLTAYRPNEQSAGYFREVIDTFLFGFDAASISLCGAALEQVLRDFAVRSGEYTAPQLDKSQTSVLTLLNHAKNRGTIRMSYDAAKQVITERNRLLHRRMQKSTELKSIALQSIRDLGEVLVEIGDSLSGNT